MRKRIAIYSVLYSTRARLSKVAENHRMGKASWIDAFVRHMTELGVASIKLGQLGETLWPHMGSIDPEKVARAEHDLWDATKDSFPDTECGSGL